MALRKSNMVLGTGQPAPVSGCAGALVVQRVKHPVVSALALNDILEIGILPPYHYLVGARLFVNGVPAESLGDVKLMSGTPDDADAGRVQTGAAILTEGDLNDDGRLIASVDYPRGIAVAIAAAIAANPANSIHLDLIYAQG